MPPIGVRSAQTHEQQELTGELRAFLLNTFVSLTILFSIQTGSEALIKTMFAPEDMYALPSSAYPDYTASFTAGSVMEEVEMGDAEYSQLCQDEMDRQVGAKFRAAFPNVSIDAIVDAPYHYPADPIGAEAPLQDILSFGDCRKDFPNHDPYLGEYIGEDAEGLEFSDDELEDVPSPLAENMATVLTDLWKNGLPAEFDTDEPSAHPATVRQDQWLLDTLKQAMSDENLCQDLLHYQWVPEASPEYPAERLEYLLQQYGCAQRFLFVAERWSWARMKICDWVKEMRIIVEASDEVNNKMTLWPQIDAIFTKFEDEARMEAYLDWWDRSKHQLKTRRDLVREMKTVGKGLVKGIETELEAMLPREISVPSIRQAVKKVVADDCEEFGSLRLGGVPGFTKQIMSQRWSWTD